MPVQCHCACAVRNQEDGGQTNFWRGVKQKWIIPLLQSRTRRTTFIKRSYEKAFHFRTMTPNMIYRHQEPNATQIVSGSTTSPSTVNVSPAWTSDGTMRETIHCKKMWVLKIHVLHFMLNNGSVSFNGHFFSLIWFLCKKK